MTVRYDYLMKMACTTFFLVDVTCVNLKKFQLTCSLKNYSYVFFSVVVNILFQKVVFLSSFVRLKCWLFSLFASEELMPGGQA